MPKRQGWYMYETVGFILPDNSKVVKYTCSNCDYEGTLLLPGSMDIDDELFCGDCGCVVIIKEHVR